VNASLKVYTGLGLVAIIEGGDGGLSLINISAGITIAIVIIEFIVIKLLNLEVETPTEFPPQNGGSLSLSSNIITIMIMLTKSPKGPLTIPTAVAILLSLSPNQLLASFVTGFLKKA